MDQLHPLQNGQAIYVASYGHAWGVRIMLATLTS